MILAREEQDPVAVGRHYDELDPYYRELWGEHVHHGLWTRGDETPDEAVLALVERVADLAGLRGGHRVCDVGCGYGATARWLAERHGAEVVGFTVSAAQHARAVRDALPGIVIHLRDWMENGLDPGSCDAVLAIESLSHLRDKPGFFREAHRVLRPGGRAVVAAWLAAGSAAPWKVRHLLEPICREGRLPGLACADEVEEWMARAGFRDVRRHPVTHRVRRTWSICLRRVALRAATDPGFVRFLVTGPSSARAFSRAVVRIHAAYRLGAMEYALFEGRKPG